MLFRRKSLSAAHSWEMGSSARPPREWSIVIHYLEFCLEELSLLSHLFSCLFMSTWTHKYIFHPLDYTPDLFIHLLLKFFQLWTWGALSVRFKYLTYIIFLLPEEFLLCFSHCLQGSADNEFLKFACEKIFISPLLKDESIGYRTLGSYFLSTFQIFHSTVFSFEFFLVRSLM